MEKIIGVYKITNPNGKVYIGSSKDIKKRFCSYINLHCKDQPKIYNSFLKYGVSNHIFTVEKECDISELYYFELEIGLKYDCIKKGLNCALPSANEKKQQFSLETIAKISESKKGIKNPQFGRKGILNPSFGKIRTKEHCANLSKSLKGRQGKRGELNHFFGKKDTIEQTLKKREKMIGHNNIKARKVINVKTGVIFDCIKYAAEHEKVKYDWLKAKINGTNKNTTDYIYFE